MAKDDEEDGADGDADTHGCEQEANCLPQVVVLHFAEAQQEKEGDEKS